MSASSAPGKPGELSFSSIPKDYPKFFESQSKYYLEFQGNGRRPYWERNSGDTTWLRHFVPSEEPTHTDFLNNQCDYGWVREYLKNELKLNTEWIIVDIAVNDKIYYFPRSTFGNDAFDIALNHFLTQISRKNGALFCCVGHEELNYYDPSLIPLKFF